MISASFRDERRVRSAGVSQIRLDQSGDEELAMSAVFQAQSGFRLTISVFGDTANAGTLLGENPDTRKLHRSSGVLPQARALQIVGLIRRRLCDSGSIHLRRRGPKHRIWSRMQTRLSSTANSPLPKN